MKYFLDSAKLDEIKYAYENYGIDGVNHKPETHQIKRKAIYDLCKRDCTVAERCRT